MPNYLTTRLREPSTWAGIAAIIQSAALVYTTRDPQALGSLVAGVAAIVMPERKAP